MLPHLKSAGSLSHRRRLLAGGPRRIYEHLLASATQAVATTMNRPERLNVRSPELIRELVTALADANPATRVVLYTGRFMNADEAERWGYVNRIGPARELIEAAIELADQIAAGPPIVLPLTKLQVYRGLDLNRETALEVAAAAETVTASSEDAAEGRRSFLERRPPAFQGR